MDLIIIPDISPWTIRTPNINLTLCKFHKNKTHPLIFQEELEKVKERYPKHSHIFMDGCKLQKINISIEQCKKLTVLKGKIFSKKHLPNNSYIQHRNLHNQNGSWPHFRIKNNKFIIFSDSLSVLESLKNRKFDNPLIIKILYKFRKFVKW